ncbi:succinate dehydrogenase assembly factor 2 [Teredinibacter haidensis]|uniref:FAD assembly factor SdhE n=1 Tax=Teredinibacter haidensis TaxID=2731755 RepID=UPI000948BF41|nr:succinate dehydrogenase assembly factor 2 [Teredinibacter haidensis]
MEINRLRWAARRGMLELDLILAPFVENVYQTLEEHEQKLFQELLECEDQDMFNWFLRKGESEDPDIQKIVRIVQSHTGKQVE